MVGIFLVLIVIRVGWYVQRRIGWVLFVCVSMIFRRCASLWVYFIEWCFFLFVGFYFLVIVKWGLILIDNFSRWGQRSRAKIKAPYWKQDPRSNLFYASTIFMYYNLQILTQEFRTQIFNPNTNGPSKRVSPRRVK